jgi:hypothetical protein
MSGGAWFSVVVLAVLVLAFTLQARRRRQEAPLRTWITGQPVVFETRALVRIRASGLDGSGWGTLKSPMGARLVVHVGGLEASIGSGNAFVAGNFMSTSDATMWRDQVGWAGTAIGRQERIRLHGFDGRRARDWAVIPRGCSIEEVWQALLGVGVKPSIQQLECR